MEADARMPQSRAAARIGAAATRAVKRMTLIRARGGLADDIAIVADLQHQRDVVGGVQATQRRSGQRHLDLDGVVTIGQTMDIGMRRHLETEDLAGMGIAASSGVMALSMSETLLLLRACKPNALFLRAATKGPPLAPRACSVSSWAKGIGITRV